MANAKVLGDTMARISQAGPVAIAQLATWIDGEGTIVISKAIPKGSRKPVHALNVCVYNTDPRVAIWIRDTFGVGRIYYSPRVGVRRPKYVWMISAVKAEAILRCCLNHFCIKKEQAEVALAFRDALYFQVNRKVTPDIVAKRDVFKKRLSDLKNVDFETTKIIKEGNKWALIQ